MFTKKFVFNLWPFFLLLLLTTLIAWPIFLPGYFSHQDDLQVMRIFEMRKCIEDLQIPCRWVPDLGFGNGYPLFNYYNVFPYYIGTIGSYFLGFIGSAKLLFFIAVTLAGVSMYLLAKRLFGTYPALLATTLYMFAPYRALDIYVRGAVAESFSIAITPLILYFAFKLTKKDLPKFKIGLALSFAAFLTSHNIMTLIFLPVISTFLLIWFWKREFAVIKSLILSLLLGFGLSAFFIIPAFLEKNLVQIDNLVKLELDFRGHFVSLSQLFLDRSWGFDTISFQIGWPHWFLAIGSIISWFFVQKRDYKWLILYFAILLIFVGSIFMTHIRSAFIWEGIGILRFTQFPWRFLSIVIFSSSLLGGFFIYNLKESVAKIATVILIIVTVFLNWNYFKPQQFMFDLSDKEKLSGKLWETQQKAVILDYLPKTALEPREKAPNGPILRFGEADFQDFNLKSNSFRFKAKVSSPSEIEIPVFDFPNWTVSVNGKRIEHSNKNYLGRIELRLNPGNYLVFGKFEDTLIRRISNIISLFSILLIIVIPIYGKIRKADH